MKNITIPVDIPTDIMVALNESEQELKSHFQVAISMMLFHERKLTIGKAIQMSGLSRYEFEKSLSKYNIPLSNPDIDQIMNDAGKLKDI